MFDIKVITKTTEANFVGFDKRELQNLRKYFQDRKVKVRGNEEFEMMDQGVNKNTDLILTIIIVYRETY